MHIISIYSPKGGVGKSVTSVNLAYLLSITGYKTLLWDMDMQGASSFYLRVKPKLDKNIEKLLIDYNHIDKNIKESDYENLYIIPSDTKLREIDIILEDLKKASKKVKNTLTKGGDFFDFIVIDAPPGFTNVNKLICKISDVILIPLIPTVLSMRSLDMVYEFFENEKIDKIKIAPFFSMADMRKGIHKNIIEENIKNFPIKTIIPYSSEIEKMGVYLKAVNDFSHSKNIKDIYERFKDEVLLLCKKISE